MWIITWAVRELLSYGVGPWATFLLIAVAAAYVLRVPGIVLGHLLITGIIVMLDAWWIRSEMSRPGWAGEPDRDFVFALGVAMRVLMVNAVLWPVNWAALRVRSRPAVVRPGGTAAAE